MISLLKTKANIQSEERAERNYKVTLKDTKNMNLSTPASYTNVTKQSDKKKDNPKQILANQTKKSEGQSEESDEKKSQREIASRESRKSPSPFSKVQIVFIVRGSFIETKLIGGRVIDNRSIGR